MYFARSALNSYPGEISQRQPRGLSTFQARVRGHTSHSSHRKTNGGVETASARRAFNTPAATIWLDNHPGVSNPSYVQRKSLHSVIVLWQGQNLTVDNISTLYSPWGVRRRSVFEKPHRFTVRLVGQRAAMFLSALDVKQNSSLEAN